MCTDNKMNITLHNPDLSNKFVVIAFILVTIKSMITNQTIIGIWQSVKEVCLITSTSISMYGDVHILFMRVYFRTRRELSYLRHFILLRTQP